MENEIYTPFQKIGNIEKNRNIINDLILSVYDSFEVGGKGINIFLNNFFKSDCALCKHVMFHNNLVKDENGVVEHFNVYCLLIRQDLINQMRTNEDREIYFENAMRNVKQCSQCAKNEQNTQNNT